MLMQAWQDHDKAISCFATNVRRYTALTGIASKITIFNEM